MPFDDTVGHSSRPAKTDAGLAEGSTSVWPLEAAREVRLESAGSGVSAGSDAGGQGQRNVFPGASPHGYRDESGYAWICACCFQLYEQGRPDGENQDCKCRSRREGRPRFFNRDFDKHVELCACCGLEAVPSGSRWSVFYCRECQLMIMGMTHWAGGLVLPIGRHTLMHTWVLNWPSGRLMDYGGAPDRLAEGVIRALQAVGSGHERLEVWYPVMMARNFAELGLEGDVRLLDYLGAVEEGKLGNLGAKQRRLDGLVQGLRSSGWRPA